jgi:acetoin utilization deacetylase AcuC-like enzyme
MNVTTRGFGLFAERLCAVADAACAGRIVLALEGGYDLEALADSVSETVRVLAEPTARAREYPVAGARAVAMTRVFREAHARFWPALERRIQA